MERKSEVPLWMRKQRSTTVFRVDSAAKPHIFDHLDQFQSSVVAPLQDCSNKMVSIRLLPRSELLVNRQQETVCENLQLGPLQINLRRGGPNIHKSPSYSIQFLSELMHR